MRSAKLIGMAIAIVALTCTAEGQTQMIDELNALDLNGARQWILCRGSDRSLPVVLFVHGGPGYPLMWYSRAFDNEFINDFVVVHWDQRGAGKSFSKETPRETINLTQIVDDGLELTAHLKQKFGTDKVILVGHSWGTMVAANMAVRRPKDFQALVSVGTCADWRRGEALRHAELLKLARDMDDTDAISQLKELGPPPYVTAGRAAAFGELIIKLQGFAGTSRKLTEQELAEAMQKTEEYRHEEIAASLNALNENWNLLGNFCNSYVLRTEVPRIDVPVYFVQGEHDTNTPTVLAKEYFDALDASRGKHWIVFQGSAHMTMYEDRTEFLKVLRSAGASTSGQER